MATEVVQMLYKVYTKVAAGLVLVRKGSCQRYHASSRRGLPPGATQTVPSKSHRRPNRQGSGCLLNDGSLVHEALTVARDHFVRGYPAVNR